MAEPDEDIARWVEALGGLDAGAMLDGAAARLLCDAEPEAASAALSRLLSLPSPDGREKKTLLSLCRALRPGEGALPEEQRQAIHRAARSLGHGEVTALFTEAGARLIQERHGGPAKLDNAESLGHRTQAARREENRDRLARMLADDDPMVIRSLLQNPRLTEAQVVRIAARRPVSAEVLEEIARSPRWSRRPSVRRALVHNPYAPPSLAASLLPGLAAHELREVAEGESLHAAVRASARSLLAARAAGGS